MFTIYCLLPVYFLGSTQNQFDFNYLILPVAFLGMLNYSITELKYVTNGLISLVTEVTHLEQGTTLPIHRNTQEAKYLENI